jgi:hypothetical protein
MEFHNLYSWQNIYSSDEIYAEVIIWACSKHRKDEERRLYTILVEKPEKMDTTEFCQVERR